MADTGREGREGRKSGHQKEVSEGEDNKEPVGRLCGTDHERLEAHEHLMLFKHDLDFPAMGIMGQDFNVRKADIQANERAQSAFPAKSLLGIGQQDNTQVDPIKLTLVTMGPILVPAHCNEVVLVVWEL